MVTIQSPASMRNEFLTVGGEFTLTMTSNTPEKPLPVEEPAQANPIVDIDHEMRTADLDERERDRRARVTGCPRRIEACASPDFIRHAWPRQPL